MLDHIRYAVLFAALRAGIWGLSTLLSLDFATLLAASSLAVAVRAYT